MNHAPASGKGALRASAGLCSLHLGQAAPAAHDAGAATNTFDIRRGLWQAGCVTYMTGGNG